MQHYIIIFEIFQARDLIAWTDIVITEMQSDQPIRDLQGAEWLHKV